MAGQKDAAEHKDQKRRLDAGLKVIQYVGQNIGQQIYNILFWPKRL